MDAALKLRNPSGRGENRRKVAFSLSARVREETRSFDVENVSENGVLLADSTGLRVGAIIEFAIPEDGWCYAEIVRTDGKMTGCRFFQPISQAAIASILLRSHFVSRSIRSGLTPNKADGRLQHPNPKVKHIDMRGSAIILFVLCAMLGIVLIG